MRRVRVGCEFVYVAEVDTPTVFQVEARDEAPVEVACEVSWTQPHMQIRRYMDLYHNRCVRLILPAGRSLIRYRATTLVPDAAEDTDEHASQLLVADLPDDVLVYTLPSRFCLPDILGDEAWQRLALCQRATRGSRRSADMSTRT